MEFIVCLLIVIADQLSKFWVNSALSVGESVPVIASVFHITNVHNTGAAWGMLSGGRVLFLIFTPIFCGFLLYILIKFRSRLTVFGRLCVALLFAGAVGNFIDRLALGYVRDMFDVCLISFPVFNVADSAITIGAFMLIFDTLFHKENSVLDIFEKKPASAQADASNADSDPSETSDMPAEHLGAADTDDTDMEKTASDSDDSSTADGV